MPLRSLIIRVGPECHFTHRQESNFTGRNVTLLTGRQEKSMSSEQEASTGRWPRVIARFWGNSAIIGRWAPAAVLSTRIILGTYLLFIKTFERFL